MDSLTATLNDSSSERAQQQLEGLRTAVETRLSTLEAVLADPTRGESLEGLILDLARVATEEARALALKATLDARLEADARIVHARTMAQEAIDQERVVGGELRRTIEQARQRITSLENGQLTQLRSLREDLESEIARERAAAANFERAASEATRQLEAERAAAAELRRAIDGDRTAEADLRLALEHERAVSADLRAAADAEQKISTDLQRSLEAEQTSAAELRQVADRTQALSATLAREKAEAWAAQDALAFDLARERDRAAKLQKLNEDLQRELDQARTATETTSVDIAANEDLARERHRSAELQTLNEELQQELDRARTRSDAIRIDLETEALARERDRSAELQRASEDLQRELAAARTEADVIRVDLEAAGGRLEMLDSERLRADRARKELEARVDALVHERDAIATQLRAARQATESQPGTDRLVVPEIAVVAPPPREVAAVIAPVAAPTVRQTADEEWGPIRLAVRFAFKQPIPIQVNGDAGLLIDLSVAGCQFVSSTSVRPNQVVKVLLPVEDATIVCTGKVMWARFEPRAAGGSIGYRAGVHFTKPDQAALEGFISSSRTPPPH